MNSTKTPKSVYLKAKDVQDPRSYVTEHDKGITLLKGVET